MSSQTSPYTAKTVAKDDGELVILDSSQDIQTQMSNPFLFGQCEDRAASDGKSFVPLRIVVQNGAAHMIARFGDLLLYVEAQIGDAWTPCKVRVLSRVTSAKILLTNSLVLGSAQPHWLRAKDSYANIHASFSSCTSHMIAKVVSMYEHANSKVLRTLAPYHEKGQSMASYTSEKVYGMVVAVKARVATSRERAAEHVSMCYIKFRNGFVYVHGLVGDRVVTMKVRLSELTRGLNIAAAARFFTVRECIQDTASSVRQFARCKARVLNSKVNVSLTDQSMKVTAVGAVGGAATMAVGGGGVGLASGAVVGAACGVVPAVFTFGLSIPIGAAIGGAAGLCAGVVGGGAVGLVGGAATARSVHRHREEVQVALNKASGCTDYVTRKAIGYTGSAVETTRIMKLRFLGGTGGTPPSDSDSPEPTPRDLD